MKYESVNVLKADTQYPEIFIQKEELRCFCLESVIVCEHHNKTLVKPTQTLSETFHCMCHNKTTKPTSQRPQQTSIELWGDRQGGPPYVLYSICTPIANW